MDEVRRSSPSGIVLVLVAGVLSLLFLLAVAFLSLVSSGASGQVRAGAGADLAAASGMDYAAARLLQERTHYPRRPAAAATRGDDWVFRDLPVSGAAGAANPSYSHGEPWTDADGDGRRGAGEPCAEDRDRDGRFSAWTGRMRGARSDAFSLKIESAGARIPVNAGFLDGGDRNANGAPDHRDLAYDYHLGLAHALNNLGSLVLPAGHPRRIDWPTTNPKETFRYSWLGTDLLAGRPQGGYRSESHLRQVLASLGAGTWYPGGRGCDEALPYLDPSRPPASTPQAGPPWGRSVREGPSWLANPWDSVALPAGTHVPESHVELATAAPVVLESLWRYQCAFFWDLVTNSTYAVDPDWLSVLNPRFPGTTYSETEHLVIFPDEARRLAAAAVALRDAAPEGVPSWKGFLAHLMQNAASMDTRVYGPGAPSDGRIFMSAFDPDPVGQPVAHARYAQMMADLAFASVVSDPHPFSAQPPSTWAGWGIPRMVPAGGGATAPLYLPCSAEGMYLTAVVPTADVEELFRPNSRPIAPLRLTTRAPVRFLVSSSGRAEDARALVHGQLRRFSQLALTSQEDFEALRGSPELSRIGVRVDRSLPFGRLPAADTLGSSDAADDRTYPGLASLPLWPRGSFPPGVALLAAETYYPRHAGALALAARECGTREADLYWAFGETDADTPPGFPSESAASVAPIGWPLDPRAGSPPTRYEAAKGFTAHHALGATTAWHPSRSVDLPPGGFLNTKDGAPTEGFTMEAWLSSQRPELLLRLGAGGYIRVFCDDFDLVGPDGSLLSLWVRSGAVDDRSVKILLDGGENASRIRHVQLAVRRVTDVDAAAGETPRADLSLYVDGDALVDPILSLPLSSTSLFSGDRLSIAGGDEPRLYRTPRGRIHAGITYGMGRFAPKGTYASPLYTFDEPVSMGPGQWIGLVPPSWRSPFGGPARPISVRVTGYAGPDGTGPVGTAPLGDAFGTTDLSGAFPEVRSMRYEVEIDADSAVRPGPVVDTPVLESVWLTFREARRPAAWEQWGAP